MVWAIAGLAAIACLWLGSAAYLAAIRQLSFRQAALYAPLKLAFLIRDDRLPTFDKARGTIYVVSHRSRLDPALMLALLPEDTLHILDRDAATSWWMEPFRELARTIPFNATHVFVSRRLVRILRGNGRIAVYLPDDAEPDTRAFRLFRAVARIATKADAAIVTIRVGNPGSALCDPSRKDRITSWPRPPLTFSILAPVTIAELRARLGENAITASNALFDRLAQTRINDVDRLRSAFDAVAMARRFGEERTALLAAPGRTMSHRELMVTTRLLATRLATRTQPGDAVALMLSEPGLFLPAFLATQSAGVVATIFDRDHDPQLVAKAVRGAAIRKVLTSRNAAEQGFAEALETAEAAGARLIHVEDILDKPGHSARFMAGLMRHRPLASPDPDTRAAMIVSGGAENPRLDIVSHRRLLTATAQAAARLDLARADVMVSALAPSQLPGITLGLLLPLSTATQLSMGELTGPVPSPAPGRDVILLARASEARALLDLPPCEDGQRLRAILLMGQPLAGDLLAQIAGAGVDVLEAWAPSSFGDMATLSSASHRRAGSVGRLLPSLRARIEPVEGLERGGRLLLAGVGSMTGWLDLDEAGRFEAYVDGWSDTNMLVVPDREGFLTLLGQAGNAATIDGAAVPLGPAETMAATLWPQALHAAIAATDRRKGERIVLATTEPAADRTALRKLAKTLGIGERVLPAEIVVLDRMPVDENGAPDRASLAAQLGTARDRSDATAA